MLRTAFLALTALALLSPAGLADTLKVKKGQSIQSVIDQAAAGDTVLVPKGVYVEVLLVPSGKPGLRLLGKGAILEARPEGAEGSGAGVTIDANDVTLSGFEIRHARSGSNPLGGSGSGLGVVASGARITLSKLVVRGCGSGGVVVDGPDAQLEKLLVEGVDGDGVVVSGSGALVRQVQVERALGTALHVAGNDLLVTQCEASFGHIGIVVDGDTGVVLSKCRVQHMREYGLLSQSGGAQLVDNKVEHVGRGLLAFGDTVHVEGNRIENSVHLGIEASGSGVTLVKNVVTGLALGESGVRVGGSSVFVSDNVLIDLGAAGLVVEASSGEVIGNRVQRCGLLGNGPALLVAGEGLQVSKNKVLDSRGTAVLLELDDGLFENNTIQGGQLNGVVVGPGADDLTLRKNKLSKLFGEGIQNFGDATVLQGNKVSNTRAPLTNDTDGGATLVDLGGNKFGKGASAANAPQPELAN